MECFYIYATRWNGSQLYKLRIEILYKSEQIIRLKITAGQRNIRADKYLLRKNNQWKLVSANFRLEIGRRDTLMTVKGILRQIEDHLKSPEPPRINPKNVPWGSGDDDP